MAYQIKYACVSHIGNKRKNNEDNFWCCGKNLPCDNEGSGEIITGTADNTDLPVLAVFDGMGGESSGEMAAYTASCELGVSYEQKKEILQSDPQHFCTESTTLMNRAVCQYAKDNQIYSMGTTLAMIAFGNDVICTCNLGDSRIYKLQNGKLEQISKDHVWGGKTFGKAPLTQCLGIEEETMVLEPEIQEVNYKNKVQILLCSDGVTDMLSDNEIEEILNTQGKSQAEIVNLLLEGSLEKGGRDNITIVLCEIKEQKNNSFFHFVLDKFRR